MILRRLRVHPFGCFADRSFTFDPGLNVVLGPNEAGKSTLFNAVKASFLRTRLSKPDFRTFIADFLPVGGGDFVRLELEFQAHGGTWLLKRRWGTSPSSELAMPNGGSIADDEDIGGKLESVLPARQGTFWRVLLTGQSELAETLASLRGRGKDSLADLADILRRAVLETGGVSVDRFMTRLTELRNGAFSRWDAARAGPEGNRGIENPWKKEVGTILQAWYDTEHLRAAWKQAEAYETGLDDVNGTMRTVASRLSALEAFLSENAAAAKGARERKTIEAELGKVRLEVRTLVKASLDWPVAAHAIRELEEAMAADKAAGAPLEQEMRAARRAEEGRGLRERHARAMRRLAQVEEARAKLAAVPRMERKSMEEIRGAAAVLEKLQAGLEAGRLSVTVAGRAEVELVVQEDFKPESRAKLAPGETTRLQAAGKIRIVHPAMEIEVRSGHGESEAAAGKAAAARRALDELLARSGVHDPGEAAERSRTFETLAADVAAGEKNLAEELAGATLADLQAQVAALGPVEKTRPLSEITSDLATLTAQGAARAARLGELRRQAEEWACAYGTPEQLIERLGEAKARDSDLTGRLEGFAPLPAGFADADAFLRELEARQDELNRLNVELGKIEERKHGLEKQAPDQSADELAAQVKSAEESLRAALRRGEALERIRALSASLLAQSDSAVFAGMRARLEPMVAAMTGGRHARVDMDGSLPKALADGPGKSVGWEQLSTGTRDSLALALRLAMASYFLGDADGFMMLDDPLVDMDPDRQRAAAEALKAFSAGRQLIVLACHPPTADLLGGNLIRLDS